MHLIWEERLIFPNYHCCNKVYQKINEYYLHKNTLEDAQKVYSTVILYFILYNTVLSEICKRNAEKKSV